MNGSLNPKTLNNSKNPIPSDEMEHANFIFDPSLVTTSNAINSIPWWPGKFRGDLKRACKGMAIMPMPKSRITSSTLVNVGLRNFPDILFVSNFPFILFIFE